MQSFEGGVWRAFALSLFKEAWNGADHDSIAALLELGESDDRPFRSDLRKNYPDNPTEEDVCEAVQKILVRTGDLKPFGMGPDMPSQWADPTPVLSVRAVSHHAGVGEEAVRVAIRRGAIRHVPIDGKHYVRVSDAENYYGAWDPDKSDRIVYEMRQYGRISIRDSIAYLLNPLERPVDD